MYSKGSASVHETQGLEKASELTYCPVLDRSPISSGKTRLSVVRSTAEATVILEPLKERKRSEH